MKLCVFADVHGNTQALDAMLSAERTTADRFVFAGDIFGYFYGQQDIIERLMSLQNLVAVRGNHENYYLAGERLEELTDRYGSSYTLSLLETQRNFLRALPSHTEFVADGKRVALFHGGPADDAETRIYPDTVLETVLPDPHYDILIVAHTHYRLFQKCGGVTVLNPGSLGQPRDGKGFSYCLLDTKTEDADFKTVTVPVQDLLRQVKERDGDNYVYSYLQGKYGDMR